MIEDRSSLLRQEGYKCFDLCCFHGVKPADWSIECRMEPSLNTDPVHQLLLLASVSCWFCKVKSEAAFVTWHTYCFDVMTASQNLDTSLGCVQHG